MPPINILVEPNDCLLIYLYLEPDIPIARLSALACVGRENGFTSVCVLYRSECSSPALHARAVTWSTVRPIKDNLTVYLLDRSIMSVYNRIKSMSIIVGDGSRDFNYRAAPSPAYYVEYNCLRRRIIC